MPEIYETIKSPDGSVRAIVMEVVPHHHSMFSFLRERNKFAPEVREKVDAAFSRFAKKLANYSSVGDFHLNQAVYSDEKGEFILLDSHGVSQRFNPSSEHDVGTRNPLTLEILKQKSFAGQSNGLSVNSMIFLQDMEILLLEERLRLEGLHPKQAERIKNAIADSRMSKNLSRCSQNSQ